jgi:hypothetical protein
MSLRRDLPFPPLVSQDTFKNKKPKNQETKKKKNKKKKNKNNKNQKIKKKGSLDEANLPFSVLQAKGEDISLSFPFSFYFSFLFYTFSTEI